MPMQMSKQS